MPRPEMRAALRGFALRLTDLIYPPVCAGCRAATARHGALCARCWAATHFIEPPYCAVSGDPMAFEIPDEPVRLSVLADPPAFRVARSAVVHTGLGMRLPTQLKYSDRADLAPIMAQWMARAGAELFAQADMIVPVPLHRRRQILRRFNQARELARALSPLAGLPVADAVLVRRRATASQVGLDRHQRAANVRGAFDVPARQRDRLRGRGVLLVDDVFTTGATVQSASRALIRGGASHVVVLTFSRVASEVAAPHMWTNVTSDPGADGAGNGIYAAALRFLQQRQGTPRQEGSEL